MFVVCIFSLFNNMKSSSSSAIMYPKNYVNFREKFQKRKFPQLFGKSIFILYFFCAFKQKLSFHMQNGEKFSRAWKLFSSLSRDKETSKKKYIRRAND